MLNASLTHWPETLTSAFHICRTLHTIDIKSQYTWKTMYTTLTILRNLPNLLSTNGTRTRSIPSPSPPPRPTVRPPPLDPPDCRVDIGSSDGGMLLWSAPVPEIRPRPVPRGRRRMDDSFNRLVLDVAFRRRCTGSLGMSES